MGIINVLIVLNSILYKNTLLDGVGKILIKETDSENFTGPGKPFRAEIVVIGMTELKRWVSNEERTRREVLGDDRAKFLERRPSKGLRPGKS